MGNVCRIGTVYRAAWVCRTVTSPKHDEPAPVGAGSQALEKVVIRKWLGD